MAYCVKLCGMTQIKTAENQMSISQQCTNTIFIAKMYVKDSFFETLLSDILSWETVYTATVVCAAQNLPYWSGPLIGTHITL